MPVQPLELTQRKSSAVFVTRR